ncbi:MAG: hypothetical protein KDB27_24315, partial [Planctomycetales bacterium]|nr:hypothetical protein [Planctomycetales bacterium]
MERIRKRKRDSSRHTRATRFLRAERLEDRHLLTSIKGEVWHDWNRDGHQEKDDEHPVADVEVRLIDANTGDVISSQLTDEEGGYEFPQIDPGEFIVEFVPDDDFEFTQPDNSIEKKDSDANPATGRTKRFTAALGERVLSVDAGIFSPVPAQSVSGNIWNDLNANGIQESGEPGVRNIEVQVENIHGEKLYWVQTDSNGEFFFDGKKLLPGDYQLDFQIDEDSTADWALSPAHARDGTVPRLDSDVGARNRTAPFTLKPKSLDVPDTQRFDAGVFQSSQIIGRVWHDIDRNGAFGVAEYGVEQYKISLLDSFGGLLQETYSDTEGLFNFVVDPGDYMMEIATPESIQLANHVDIGGGVGNNAFDPQTKRTKVVSVTGRNSLLNVGAGVFSNAGTQDLVGRVWHDLNADGIQDPDEPGIPDAKVELENTAFVELFDLTTDDSGVFHIDGS